MSKPSPVLHILLLEDNPIDIKVITGFVEKAGMNCSWTTVHNKEDYRNALIQKNYDLILADHQLTDFDSIEALKICNEKMPDVPFILITSTISEDFAIHIMEMGATDYLFKSSLQRLPIAIKEAIKKRNIDTAYNELRERFDLTAKATADVLWDLHLNKNLVFFSEAIENLCSIKPGFHNMEIIKKIIHPHDLKHLQKNFIQTTESGENRYYDFLRIIDSGGQNRFINLNAYILRDEQGFAYRLVGVMKDVTEITELQHRLLNQELERQKQINEVIIESQEKERDQIGKELHDNVNQLLAAAKMMIGCARTNPSMMENFLGRSEKAIMKAIDEIRNISHAMIPPSFEEIDFVYVLNNLVSQMSFGTDLLIQTKMPVEKKLEVLDNDKKLAVYRIIQEQLSNIVKYAKASKAYVIIEVQEDLVLIKLRDNGIGFDPGTKTKGIGLRNIEKRAEFFGGKMNITSAPGKGCLMIVEIPVWNFNVKENNHEINWQTAR